MKQIPTMNLFHEDRQQRTDDAWKAHEQFHSDLARFGDFWAQAQAAANAPAPTSPLDSIAAAKIAKADELIAELEAIAYELPDVCDPEQNRAEEIEYHLAGARIAKARAAREREAREYDESILGGAGEGNL